MNVEKFSGPGSTPARRKFWNAVTDQVTALTKKEGKNVTVDEVYGEHSVINVDRKGVGEITGACCDTEGNCAVKTEAQCVEDGGTYQGDGTPCDPNPCPDCSVSQEFISPGCRGTGNGANFPDSWADAISEWMDCSDHPFTCQLAFGFKSGDGSFQTIAESCPLRFTLVASASGNCNVSGVIRTRDDIAGIVDETPFSFTLTGIGDTHDLTFDPYEPVDPTSPPTPNSTHSTAEDITYDCS